MSPNIWAHSIIWNRFTYFHIKSLSLRYETLNFWIPDDEALENIKLRPANFWRFAKGYIHWHLNTRTVNFNLFGQFKLVQRWMFHCFDASWAFQSVIVFFTLATDLTVLKIGNKWCKFWSNRVPEKLIFVIHVHRNTVVPMATTTSQLVDVCRLRIKISSYLVVQCLWINHVTIAQHKS
jgi:hypothetical protein